MKKPFFCFLFLFQTLLVVAQDVKVDTLSQIKAPGSFDDLLSKAAEAVVKEDFQTAKVLYTQAVALRPSDPGAIRMLYNVVNTIKSMEEIRLHNLDLKRKADINKLLNLAQNEVMQKNYDSAKVHYTQVLALKPVKSQEDFVKQKLQVIEYAKQSANSSTAKNTITATNTLAVVSKGELPAPRKVENTTPPVNNRPVNNRPVEQPGKLVKIENQIPQQKQPDLRAQTDELKRKSQENDTKRLAQENEKRIAAELETKRIAQENESKRLQEAENKRIAQENENKRVAMENEKRLAAERENKRIALENENKRIALENEKKLSERENKRIAQETENKRIAQEAENKRIGQEAEKKLAQERETKRVAQENENRRLSLENERKIAQEAENKGIALENENKRLAFENEKKMAQEVESKRIAAEIEAKRITPENDTKRLAVTGDGSLPMTSSEQNPTRTKSTETLIPANELATKEKFNTLIESAIKAINASDWEKALGLYNEVLTLNPTPVQQKAIYNEIIVIKRNLDKVRLRAGSSVAKTGLSVNKTQLGQKESAASKSTSKNSEVASTAIDTKKQGTSSNNPPMQTSTNVSDEPVAIQNTEAPAEMDNNKENIEFSQKVLMQPASYNIADVSNDVKLTFQGISTNGRNTFFKFLVQNFSPNDFNIGTLQMTYIPNIGKLKKLNPRYISSSASSKKEFPFIVVTENEPKIEPDEVFVFEMEDQLKKTKLTLNITGDKFLNKSL